MKNDTLFVWLQLAVGLYSKLPKLLFEKLGDIESIYGCDDYSFLGSKNEKYIRKLEQKETGDAYEIVKRCQSLGVVPLLYTDERYPKLLKEIENPPPVLYTIGQIRDLNSMPCVGIVGTRNMTDYGKRVTEGFAFDLAKNGVCVVSGLAKGIDTAAHRGAVVAGGYTVAVLGNPIGDVYPKENVKAFQTLYERGLVMSELYPGAPRTRADFPHRNRIISGMSSAVLVTEAGEGSGSLITARHAATQGRRVFAVPGNVGGENVGTNMLIKKGTTAVTESSDLLSALSLEHPDWEKKNDVKSTERLRSYGNASVSPPKKKKREETKIEAKPSPPRVQPSQTKVQPAEEASDPSSPAEIILAALMGDRPISADEICAKTGIDIAKIMSELTMLEIEGKIIAAAGGRYISAKFK